MTTLWQLLDESASRYGEKTALKMKRGYAVERWSYQHLRQVSEGVAAYLHAEGVSKGECVLVCAPNMPEWVALYFGCMRSGVILVPIDVRSTPDFIESINEQTTQLAELYFDTCPASPELTLAVRKLQEARMWANAALATNQ